MLRLFSLLLFGCCSLAVAIERKAVWLRPTDDQADLEQMIDQAAKAGFTDVLLESFYHAQTIYPSEIAPTRFNFDALSLASLRCNQLGLKLHAWVEVLYWSPEPKWLTQSSLWLSHPEWETRDKSGRLSKNVLGMGFVDPAIPEVRQTMINLASELGQKYPEIGLHLDYLRYPRPTVGDFGYNPVALERYKAEITNQNNENWTKWRADQVTGLANEMINAYKTAGGQGLVSAAVLGAPPADPLQDWNKWNGLQAAMPMLYAPNMFLLELGARAIQLQPSPVARWLGLKVGLGWPDLASQLATADRLGFKNVAIFGWQPS